VSRAAPPGSRPVTVRRFGPAGWAAATGDDLAAEEPLEIRVEGRSVAVVMRTPGDDRALAAGFLLTEGVILGRDDLHALAAVDDPARPRGNTVDCVLASGVPAARRHAADRALYASSSCGVCGKETIDRIFQAIPPLRAPPFPDPAVLLGLDARVRPQQATFARTGGLHAAALFSLETGAPAFQAEDIGRHNAVDKVIGAALLADALDGPPLGLWVSGRAGFEIVQKALMAGIGLVAAVGAPSSLAAALAARAGQHLVGFLRNGGLNLYGSEADAPGLP
jgi:FdhD protein